MSGAPVAPHSAQLRGRPSRIDSALTPDHHDTTEIDATPGGRAESATHGWHLPILPVPLSPIIGRDREVSELSALLSRPEVRLVTLVGPGGVGKTRLAIASAA